MRIVWVNKPFSFIALQQPRIRRGSYATSVGTAPVLDVFVAGHENQASVECLSPEGVSSLPDRSPVYFYGPSGAGKTALALSLASRWLSLTNHRTITITTGADFAKALARAIDADDMARFRQVHRECNCLLIDNIHELVNKPAAQEEMLSTIEHMLSNGQAVIVTARELPSLVFPNRLGLVSRLHSGLSVPLEYPSRDTRVKLLRLLAAQLQFNIDTSELESIEAQLIDGMSATQMKGILNRWSHHHQLNPSRTERESKRMIDNILDGQMAKSPPVSEIAKAVARELRVTLENLQGPSRKSSVVRARGLAIYLARKLTEESYQSIGEFFGGRDHTTVMHAFKKTEEDLNGDAELSRAVDRIQIRLNA